MNGKRQKLELTWIGKENRLKLELRILLEDPELSYHAPHWVTDHDIFDNRLIFGDKLLSLKALDWRNGATFQPRQRRSSYLVGQR